MESQDILYCLSPQCLHHEARVFFKSQINYLHSDCNQWVVSQSSISDLTKDNVRFDIDIPLNFASNPCFSQAYLYFNKENISSYLNQFVQTVRSEIEKILKQFDQLLCVTLASIFSFRKYNEISQLAKTEGIDIKAKSIKLSTLLKKSLPMYQNLKLPSSEQSQVIINSLRKDLQGLLDIKGEESKSNRLDCNETKLECQVQETIVKYENGGPEMNKFQTPFKMSASKKESCDSLRRTKKSQQITSKRDDNELSELWDYIMKSCNLNTATKLMGEPLQKFYQNGGDGKESTVQCCYCPFEVTITTRSKPQNNSACSYAILQHLYKQHPSSILHYFNLLKGDFTSNTISLLLEKIKSEEVDSVAVIESASLFDIKQLSLEEDTFSFELIYGGNKPMFRKQFMKGSSPKEILVVIGFLICYCAWVVKKKITIYTSEPKCEVVNNFCKFYGIEGAKAVPGSHVAKKGVEVIMKEKAEPREQTEFSYLI